MGWVNGKKASNTDPLKDVWRKRGGCNRICRGRIRQVNDTDPTSGEQPVDRLLFLDVDGVLNPFRARHNLHADWRKRRLWDDELERSKYWVSAELGRWLHTVHDHGVRIVWATTWVNYPDDLERYAEIIGAPAALERIRFDKTADFDLRESGKRPGIAEWLAAHSPDPDDRRVVWVDDCLGDNDRRFAGEEGIVTVRPNPASGLADRKLRTLIEARLDVGRADRAVLVQRQDVTLPR